VVELACQVQAIVVIGGRNSNNTGQLYRLAAARVPAYWVESAAELRAKDFTGIKKVGVTAGASTPESVIREVIKLLKSF
jgi:4-hydroxy-3-methylbut-2-enyl diphosphate reductase